MEAGPLFFLLILVEVFLGPSYTIIGSIPTLGWVFVDRSYGCHGGETLIAISLIDGSQHELMVSGIFDTNQLQMSPKNNWLVVSSCDCSMEYTCGMEIISLKNESESEFKSVYFNQRMCACNAIIWTSEMEFTTKYAVEGNDFDCNYKEVNLSFKNNQWDIID